MPRDRLRIASVFRRFDRSGSIESLFLRNAERLSFDEDVTVFASAAKRAETTAPLSFAPVEPLLWGRTRARYAIECASFAGRATRALAAHRDRFDVVHVEGYAATDADLVTVHAVRAVELEHYFTRVEPDANPLRRRLARFVRPQTSVVLGIERRLFQRDSPPYCICPSPAVKADLERVHGVPSDRIQVLPYGVDLDRFRGDPADRARLRAELATPPDRLVLLFIGFSFERKGLDVCIEGLARSRLADAELWIVGGHEDERHRVDLGACGPGRTLRLLGTRPPSDLPGLYAAADVLVLPSRQDTWALPVTEALASGCVVVASEYAGSSALIEHGTSGYVLTGAGAAEELAALLDGPLADADVRAAVAARGREAITPYGYAGFYARYREAHHRAYELRRERAGTVPSPIRALPLRVGRG